MDYQSYQELLLWNPKPVKSIIGDGIFFEQTKIVLFGEPKLGKSVLAQQLAFCLALGVPWLGFTTTVAKVLYIQSEISKVLFKSRVVASGKALRVPPNQTYFATEFGFHLDRPEAQRELFTAIDRLKPQVVILDPKYKLISNPDEASIIRLTDTIDIMIANYGVSVLLIDHARKPRMATTGNIVDMGGTELRGPIIEQWADSIIRLRGDLQTEFRLLEFELRHASQFLTPKQIRLDRQSLWFREVT